MCLVMLPLSVGLGSTQGTGGRASAFVRTWRAESRRHVQSGGERSFFRGIRHIHATDSNLMENIISSPKSTTVKKIQSLLSKRKKRLEYGQTVVEGPRMVFDLLQNPKTQSLVRQVLISTDAFAEHFQQRLLALPSSVSPHIQLATPDILKVCSDTVTSQGIVSLVDTPQLDLTASVGGKHPFYLVLDGVSDPGNVGTLLRSSLAVGVAGVLLLPGCCDVWNPKAVRSAMGASFQLPILEVATWDQAIEVMVNEMSVKQVYAATMMEEEEDKIPCNNEFNEFHWSIDWLARPSALVVGSEGNGLSAEVRKALIEHRNVGHEQSYHIGAVHVPMEAGIESLNAAVCGSVIMFEYARQRNQDTVLKSDEVD